MYRIRVNDERGTRVEYLLRCAVCRRKFRAELATVRVCSERCFQRKYPLKYLQGNPPTAIDVRTNP